MELRYPFFPAEYGMQRGSHPRKDYAPNQTQGCRYTKIDEKIIFYVFLVFKILSFV